MKRTNSLSREYKGEDVCAVVCEGVMVEDNEGGEVCAEVVEGVRAGGKVRLRHRVDRAVTVRNKMPGCD
jgi:hypothetical protein